MGPRQKCKSSNHKTIRRSSGIHNGNLELGSVFLAMTPKPYLTNEDFHVSKEPSGWTSGPAAEMLPLYIKCLS